MPASRYTQEALRYHLQFLPHYHVFSLPPGPPFYTSPLLARRFLAFWLASLVQLGGPGSPMRAQGEGEASMKIYLIRILTGQSDPECN